MTQLEEDRFIAMKRTQRLEEELSSQKKVSPHHFVPFGSLLPITTYHGKVQKIKLERCKIHLLRCTVTPRQHDFKVILHCFMHNIGKQISMVKSVNSKKKLCDSPYSI